MFQIGQREFTSNHFIDEIDAIAKRFDAQTGADREVQKNFVGVIESNGWV